MSRCRSWRADLLHGGLLPGFLILDRDLLIQLAGGVVDMVAFESLETQRLGRTHDCAHPAAHALVFVDLSLLVTLLNRDSFEHAALDAFAARRAFVAHARNEVGPGEGIRVVPFREPARDRAAAAAARADDAVSHFLRVVGHHDEAHLATFFEILINFLARDQLALAALGEHRGGCADYKAG